jgi:DNA polymerase IV
MLNNDSSPEQLPWERAIILVDMNAFFASIEQLDFPELNGQPIVVTNGKDGTCIITCSYEARAYGIKTGMRIYDAKKLCPHLIQRPSRPQRYVAISAAIMEALEDITPDIEVFSVDEAFLDVTHCQSLHGSPIKIGQMIKQKVLEVANILCSVGISSDKTTAKFAAKLQKPNGFTVIPPWEAKQRLKNVPVRELCGIADGVGSFLAKYGVYTCGDMEKLPISILIKRFGNLGRRFWYMCQGNDPAPVGRNLAPPKSIGHGKILPPKVNSKEIILTYFMHVSEKVAARLRRHEMHAQTFFIGLRTANYHWLAQKSKLILPSNDGKDIYKLCNDFVLQQWNEEIVRQVQVTALDPNTASTQLDLFAEPDERRELINQVIDAINDKYGKLSIAPALLLGKSSIPNVIAPSWQPKGHRQTI